MATSNAAPSDSIMTEKSIDYRPTAFEHGTYRKSLILQNSGGTTLSSPISASNQTSTFEIPSKVFNLSKSELSFTMTSVVSSANTRGHVFNALGCSAIDRLSLQTRGGVYLMDITDFNFFTEAVMPYTTSIEEMAQAKVGFLGRGDSIAAAAALAYPVGLIQPGNAIIARGSQIIAPVFVPGNAAAADYEVGNRRYNAGIAASTCLEHRYVYDAWSATTTNPQFSVLRYRLQFGKLPNCILGLDKDLFFGEPLLLNVVWNIRGQIGYQQTLSTGAFERNNEDITLTDLSLYLAIETNRLIAESVIGKAMSGWAMTIPYVYINKFAPGGAAGAQTAVQMRINRGHGKSLLKIYHVMTVGGVDLSGFYLKPLQSSTQNWYTTLDNDRRQDQVLIPSSYNWLNEQDAVVKGCAIDSVDSHEYNFVWIDDWSGAPSKDWRMTDIAECGLPLNVERIWTFVHQQAAAVTHRSYIVTQKNLVIAPNQITVV